MRNCSITLLAALLAAGASAAQPAATPAPAPAAAPAAAAPAAPPAPLPTRMQFCQQEVQGLVGDDRRAALKTCLVRRAEGERVVHSECVEQMRQVPAEPAVVKQLTRDCELRALSVPSSELPRPMAPIESPAATPPATAALPAAPDADSDASSNDRAVSPVTLPDTTPADEPSQESPQR